MRVEDRLAKTLPSYVGTQKNVKFLTAIPIQE